MTKTRGLFEPRAESRPHLVRRGAAQEEIKVPVLGAMAVPFPEAQRLRLRRSRGGLEGLQRTLPIVAGRDHQERRGQLRRERLIRLARA